MTDMGILQFHKFSLSCSKRNHAHHQQVEGVIQLTYDVHLANKQHLLFICVNALFLFY